VRRQIDSLFCEELEARFSPSLSRPYCGRGGQNVGKVGRRNSDGLDMSKEEDGEDWM